MWDVIHDFFSGWGYYKPEDKKFLFVDDVHRLLGIELFDRYPPIEHRSEDVGLEEIYQHLQPKLEQEIAELRTKLRANPPRFDKFTIPKINKQYPPLPF